MPTIRDIAVLARVSTATVSHVLNESAYVSPELKERVVQAVRALNYHPDNAVARSLRTRQSRSVGMIIPDITDPLSLHGPRRRGCAHGAGLYPSGRQLR